MWATPCEHCVFHRADAIVCALGQYCVARDGQTEAPGFCRLFRTAKWAARHADHADAYESLARQETAFRYAAIALFDERRHSADQLARTVAGLERQPAYDRMIIADLTGLDGSRGDALAYQRGREWRTLVHVERLVEHVADPHAAVQFAARLVREPYFLVIEAGQNVEGLSALAEHFRDVDSRVVYWAFPVFRGRTQVAEPFSAGGVYVTRAFRQLGGNRQNPFFLKLRTIEEQLGTLLTWTFDRCVVRHGF